jgi:hypothetical protein
MFAAAHKGHAAVWQLFSHSEDVLSLTDEYHIPTVGFKNQG